MIKQTADFTITNLNKKFLPQISVNGQASYQSDVTKIEIPIPNFSKEGPAKDQYKIYGDASLLLYDGGLVNEQKKSVQLKSQIDAQKIEVELYIFS